MTGLVVLAQSTANTRVLVWVGVLLGVVLVGGFFMILLRKKLFAKDSPMEGSASLMESVREMHKKGQISSEEFDRVRKRLARTVRETPLRSAGGVEPGETGVPTRGGEFGAGAERGRKDGTRGRTPPEDGPKTM